MALRDLARDLMQSIPDSTTHNGQPGASQISGSVINEEVDRASPQPVTNVVQQVEVGIVNTTGTPPAQQQPAVSLPDPSLPTAPFIADTMIVAGTSEPQATTPPGLPTGPAQVSPSAPDYSQSPTPKQAGTVDESVAAEPELGGGGGSPTPTSADKTTAVGSETVTGETASEANNQFARFCADATPLGDMRKVVVAAEGAKRFLDMPSVDTTDLARLFEIAGWHSPHNFTQTLRNAARDKYRWLERVPGRAGRYSATDLGRSVTMAE